MRAITWGKAGRRTCGWWESGISTDERYSVKVDYIDSVYTGNTMPD